MAKKTKQIALNILDFVDNICLDKCGMCEVEADIFQGPDSEDLFCYTLYSCNPMKFMKKVLPKLNEVKVWPWDTDLEEDYEELIAFYDIFCDAGACKFCDETDEQTKLCLEIFRQYVDCVPFENDHSNTKKEIVSTEKFFSNSWDRICQVADSVLFGEGQSQSKKDRKQRIKIRNQGKKLSKKQKRRAKKAEALAKKRKPEVCIFTNMSDEKFNQYVSTLDEDNNRKQVTVEGST